MQAIGTPGRTADLHAIRKLHAFSPLSGEDREILARLLSRRFEVDPREDILVEGARPQDIFLIASGWAIRYKLLADGRRQIIDHLIPGDFFGLRASLFAIADDSVQALTRTTVIRIPGSAYQSLLRDHPKLGLAIMWSVMREHSIVAEHVVCLGRRSAQERLAHLIVELLRRLQLVHLAGERDYHLPLTQEILADTLGLSIVHVNRALRRLRQEGMIALDSQRRRIVINDLPRLYDIAEFTSAYLEQQSPHPGRAGSAE